MQINFFDSLPSTQEYLIAQIKSGAVDLPLCIVAKAQNRGIGSRGNEWSAVENGLYFSFALSLDSLPKDLKMQSMAIFFAFNFMQILRNLGSKIWLKYPNDLFLGTQKIGGVLCSVAGDFAVCGIGLNLASQNFAHLEPQISAKLDSRKSTQKLLQDYFNETLHSSWSVVFSAYSAEFYKNYDFSFHGENDEILSLKNAELQKDGAIKMGDKLIYCAR